MREIIKISAFLILIFANSSFGSGKEDAFPSPDDPNNRIFPTELPNIKNLSSDQITTKKSTRSIPVPSPKSLPADTKGFGPSSIWWAQAKKELEEDEAIKARHNKSFSAKEDKAKNPSDHEETGEFEGIFHIEDF